MRYGIELSDHAAEFLRTLPVDVVVCVSIQLERLAEAPLELGRRAHFPYRPAGQIFEFWCEESDQKYFVTAFFHFSAGANVIRVYAITAREFER